MLARRTLLAAAAALSLSLPAMADENLLGYVRGAETLPKGSGEFYQWFTVRSDKGAGSYRALDTKTEVEYGVTDRFQVSAELNGLGVHTSGLRIDGYLPADKATTLQLRSVELSAKYNFLSPAKDDFGLSAIAALELGRLDVHSGQAKREIEFSTELQAQKYFLEGQLVWVGNIGLRAAREKRSAIANLPDGFDWPGTPEDEITTKIGTGLSYRFAPGWVRRRRAAARSRVRDRGRAGALEPVRRPQPALGRQHLVGHPDRFPPGARRRRAVRRPGRLPAALDRKDQERSPGQDRLQLLRTAMRHFVPAAFLLPLAAIVAPAHGADYLTAAAAQSLLFPGANSFVARPLRFSAAQRDQIKALAGVRQRLDEQPVWRAERDGALVGWFIVDDVIGKHEFITYAAAIAPDGKVLGIEVLSYRETHGGQIRDPAWRRNFVGKTLASPFKLDQDVPNISGATLSSRNVLDGVKRLLVIHQLFLARG